MIKKSKEIQHTYVAFLRGINVGGHHKVPMADLKTALQKIGFENVVTLLNSGNIIFDTSGESSSNLEKTVSEHLETTFGFPIPTIIRTAEMICDLLDSHPFKEVVLTKDIRCYVSFLRKKVTTDLPLPWTSANGSFKILGAKDQTILSVVDLAIAGTIEAMKVLENQYGKDIITTRNWKTIERIGKKLNPEQ
jgi:uncharacterized protein (DUF1697 family)